MDPRTWRARSRAHGRCSEQSNARPLPRDARGDSIERVPRRDLARACVVASGALLAFGVLATLAGGCGGGKETKTAAGGDLAQGKWPEDDKSLCDWKTRKDVDVVYSAGPGSFQPNVRRV